MEVYLYDLYSIALSKIARGFESDIEDVLFLLEGNHIEIGKLESIIAEALSSCQEFDIDPFELRQYFAELKKRIAQKNQ